MLPVPHLLPEKEMLNPGGKRKAVLILINGTTLDDFSRKTHPYLRPNGKRAVALMNNPLRRVQKYT